MILEIHNFTQNQIDEKFLEKIAEGAFKAMTREKPGSDLLKKKTEISLALVGEGRIRKLNKMYRGRNRVTDVLSFVNQSIIPYLAKAFPRLKDSQPAKFVEAPNGVKRLGEIVICYPRAKKQARRAGHSLKHELTILLIHGILHLLGYDHEKTEKEAEAMQEMETKILKYIEQ